LHITILNAGKLIAWLIVPQISQTLGHLCTKNKIHKDTNKENETEGFR